MLINIRYLLHLTETLFFGVLACHQPELDGFNQQPLSTFLLPAMLIKLSNIKQFSVGTLGIKSMSAGREANMLPLCLAAPLQRHFSLINYATSGKTIESYGSKLRNVPLEPSDAKFRNSSILSLISGAINLPRWVSPSTTQWGNPIDPCITACRVRKNKLGSLSFNASLGVNFAQDMSNYFCLNIPNL